MMNYIKLIPIGARYMVLSALAFACMGVFVKLAGSQGIPVMEIIAARAFVSLIISYVNIKRKGLSPFGTHRLLLIARGVVGFVALTGVFYALVHLPFAEASVLQYLHPMFTAMLALFFLKERPRLATLACIILSFTGLIIMVRPGFIFGDVKAEYDSLAVAIAIAGAFGSGLAYTIVRKLSALEDASVIVFYFPLVCLPATLLLQGNEFVMPTGWAWVSLLMVGVFTQIGQVSLTWGMTTESASRAASFSYSQVVFAAILGVVIFNEIPSLWTVSGATLIILGALVSIFWRRNIQ